MEETNPLNLFFETCVQHYGENRVRLDTEYNTVKYIYIHYPVINIKTTNNHTHTIKDLYIRISLTFLNAEIQVLTIYGIRGTLSKLEYNKRYAHPYINSDLQNFVTFCLSDFSNIRANFIIQYNLTEQSLKPFVIKSFLNSLTQYLSFDGNGGYKRTKELIGYEELQAPSKSLTALFQRTDYKVDVNEILSNIFFEFLKVTYEKGIEVIKVDRVKLEKYLLDLITTKIKTEEEFKPFFANRLLGKKVGKNYYSLDNKAYDLEEVTIGLNFLTAFGKPPFLVIEDTQPVNVLENAKTVINPLYLSTIERNLLQGYKSIIKNQLY